MKTKTVGKNSMSALAFAFAVLAGEALADVHVWTGEGGDNKWTTRRNWSPESSDPRDVCFPAGQDWTVELVANTNNWLLSLELPEGSGTVTLTGRGALKPGSGAVVKVSAGRELKVDGATLNLDGVDTSESGFFNGTLRVVSGEVKTRTTAAEVKLPTVFGGTASLIVEGGTFGVTDGLVCLTNNATLTVLGGVAQAKRWSLCSPDAPLESITRVVLKGGTFRNCDEYAYMTKLCEGARFENIGGTLIWGLATDQALNVLSSATVDGFAGFLPSRGGTLVIPTSTTGANGALHFAVNGEYNAGGTIYTTNNTAAAAGNVNFGGASVALRGGATIYANAVNVSGSVDSAADLEIERLNLGIGGFRRTATGGFQALNFLNGIVLGAWGGDVPTDNNQRLSVNLEGPVEYDTLDCFDKTTPRTINMARVKLDKVTDLKVSGGGTASFSDTVFNNTGAKDEFRTLEVADGTTLAFTNIVVGLKAMNLRLGDGATLKIDLSAGDYVDASSSAEFGAGAKIVVTALPALTAGELYPIYFAPVGTDPDTSKIEYALGAWPSGWSLAKTGSAVYLTDGNAAPYSEAQDGSTRIWSGAASDNRYANTGNWVNGQVAGASCHAFFKGNVNTVVSIDSALTLRNFNVSGGPFMFSGSTVTFEYPQVSELTSSSWASVCNEGKYPVVIANPVRAAGESCYLLFQAFGEGAISLVGGSDRAHPIGFGGDIRLGGNWEATRLSCQKMYSSKQAVRGSRLTVMPGATLTVTGQTGDVNAFGEGAFAVAKTATAVIGGTDLTFSRGNTHYVDGTLAVTCPLVLTTRQVFRGDGTLALSGGVADAPHAGVRVEGNLTLVPSNWVNEVELSVKGNVTIAPSANWTFGGAATLDLPVRSTLTLATGGHKLTLAVPLESEGSVVVAGGGTVVLASAMSLGRVMCADGAKFEASKDISVPGRYVDVLAVSEDDSSIAFGKNFAVKKRFDETTRRTVYSVKNTKIGFSLIVR